MALKTRLNYLSFLKCKFIIQIYHFTMHQNNFEILNNLFNATKKILPNNLREYRNEYREYSYQPFVE